MQKRPVDVDVVAGSLAGALARSVHLVEVVGGSGDGGWGVGKGIVRQRMVGVLVV